MLLSILIPAYQEESTIADILRLVCAVDTESHGFEKEIIVCDDASADATSARVQEVMETDSRIRLVRHEVNRGKGAAIRTALELAKGDYCLVQDADLEYSVDDYPNLLKQIEDGSEVIYGSRFLEKSWPAGMKMPNLVANRLLTHAANLFFGFKITDQATCFKLLPTELLRSMNLECERFEFCAEVTAKLGNRNIPIHEVPVQYEGRSAKEGKKITWTDGFEAMWTLLQHRVKRS